MAVGLHVSDCSGELAPFLNEEEAAGIVLRPLVSPESVEDNSMASLRISGGSQGTVTAEFPFVDGRSGEQLAAGRQQLFLNNGLGAMRGLVMVLALYLVMGVLCLAGLMTWHWMR